MKKKVLVTGADGFIGSHLVEQLVKKGFSVKAFAYYNSFNSWGWLDSLSKEILNEVEVFTGDIRDPYGVRAALSGCESVIHLAALIGIPYSYHSPETYVDTNIRGTLNVLQASRDLELSKVIHTSTSEVYGTAQYVPIDEDHPLKGQSPYSATKIGADQLAYSFYSSFDLPVVTLRPFNTYGPRQSARAVIPTIISQLAIGKGTVNLGSLEPTRDFNFVLDTVEGFISALTSENGAGEVINISSNFEVSILETAEIIARLMNKDLVIEKEGQRLRPLNSEVERLCGLNLKAKELLGWEPRFSGMEGFEKGLKETIDWFSIEENLRHYKTDIFNK